MNTKLHVSIKAAVIGFFILVAAQSTLADPITFTTTGTFNNIPAGSGCTGNGTNQIICNDGRQITYVTSTNSTNLGSFQYTNIPPSTAVGPILPGGITFTLTINQLSPTLGTGSFFGTFVVETEPVASFYFLRFRENIINIGGVPYFMTNILVPHVNLNGGAIAPVPEPATMLLLGTGLAGVVGAVRKRRKTDS